MASSALLLSLMVLLGAGGAASAGLVDPTRPPTAVGGAQPAPEAAPEVEWMLALVKFSPTHRSAVLNGRVIREGDRVAGARVLRILRDAVILEYRGRQLRVGLQHPPGEALRTPSPSGAREAR